MWPVLLNLTRDECRRTLRRLELEAYSNMISVFRAQGALEDNRKKLLEELRAVLHISNDRHSAEARRVSNDELLATIAEQLSGPNTGLGWICEGRRIIPLMPRGIPQTMYTEIADKVAENAANENKEVHKKLEEEKSLALNADEDNETQNAEETLPSNEVDEVFPPVAMEDHSSKIWETELICRKRKIPEGSVPADDSTIPIKNMRNIPANANQKHVNISQIYSRFSQTATSKSSGHSKHSYNQVSKVSTSKSHQSQKHKPRAHKQKNTVHMSKTHKKAQEISKTSSQQYSPSLPQEYSGPPNSYQPGFAHTVLGIKNTDYIDEMKSKVLSPPNVISDSPTMQLLTQPTAVPHQLGVSENSHSEEASQIQLQGKPMSKQSISGKHCHLIIKKRNETTADKNVQMSEFKILQKPAEGVKVLSNRQVVVAPSSAQKALNTAGKLVTTKVIGSIPRPRTSNNTTIPSEKMIVVSKPSADNRLPSSKIVITSNSFTPCKDSPISSHTITSKTTETLTPKGIPATDLKVSAKTFVLNPKSGQKMVVMPAKSNKEGQVPLIHFKGIPTAMKLVSVSSQPVASRQPTAAVVSKPKVVNTLPSNAKIVGVEPIRTANLADIVPVKGLTPVAATKIPNPIVRTVNPKANVIVVQKGSAIGKTITFSKNGNDMSKIIMGKNVNQLLQASKPDQAEPTKGGNVIVLELNNEQTGRPTTMSEILDSRSASVPRVPDQAKKSSELQITQDTPVLFESQISEVCNTSSLDSAVSIEDINSIEESNLPLIRKDEEDKSNFNKENIVIKDTPNVTDWEMELDTVSRKGKAAVDKLNSLHLDLGMSSDSENEYIGIPISEGTHSPQERVPITTPSGAPSERFSGSSSLSLATRTLLSQLQDDGSSSNDSSFALKSKCSDKFKESELKIDKSESEALSKAKAKLTEKVAEEKSRQKRIDVYSTTIVSSDINLDPFSYLEEGMMAGDDEFASESKRETRQVDVLDDQLCRLLGEDSANSADSQTVSESLSLNKS